MRLAAAKLFPGGELLYHPVERAEVGDLAERNFRLHPEQLALLVDQILDDRVADAAIEAHGLQIKIQGAGQRVTVQSGKFFHQYRQRFLPVLAGVDHAADTGAQQALDLVGPLPSAFSRWC